VLRTLVSRWQEQAGQEHPADYAVLVITGHHWCVLLGGFLRERTKQINTVDTLIDRTDKKTVRMPQGASSVCWDPNGKDMTWEFIAAISLSCFSVPFTCPSLRTPVAKHSETLHPSSANAGCKSQSIIMVRAGAGRSPV